MERPLAPKLVFIDPRQLKSHEKTSPWRVVVVLMQMMMDGMLVDPIVVDARSGVILDGHHRRRAGILLGLRSVPCWEVDYLFDDSITVAPRRSRIPVSKHEVVRRGISGRPYPHKTTRHACRNLPSSAPYPLRVLKRQDGGRS